MSAPPPFSYNIPPQPQPPHQAPDSGAPGQVKGGLNNLDESAAPPPYSCDYPADKPPLTQDHAPPAPAPAPGSNVLDLPDLPVVPSDTPLGGNTPQGNDDDDIDFDDLTKRFEALKKKK